MKRTLTLLTFALLMCSTVLAKDLVPKGTVVSSGASGDIVSARCPIIMLVFDTDFVGSIAGACVAGTAGVCRAGSPQILTMTFPASQGSLYSSLTWTRSAGAFTYYLVQ